MLDGFQQAAIFRIGQRIASAENGLRIKVHKVLLQGLQLPGLAIQLLAHGLLQAPLPLLQLMAAVGYLLAGGEQAAGEVVHMLHALAE